ncbi:MAG TPA: STAS domain-containing protein [Phycisphaerae bacterium]|nr:STAS domain-containing protein [Phycisphaerae bacterium]
MPTSVVKYNHVAVLTSKDDFTRDSIDQFRHAAKKCVEEGFNSLVLDCAHVGAIDSVGLETLLEMQDKCEDLVGCVKLCALDETIERILTITRLIRRFETFPDLDSAVRSFS